MHLGSVGDAEFDQLIEAFLVLVFFDAGIAAELFALRSELGDGLLDLLELLLQHGKASGCGHGVSPDG